MKMLFAAVLGCYWHIASFPRVANLAAIRA